MNELRENRHGFGHKENLLNFDGVIGDFARIPCFAIFDEGTRTSGPIISGTSWKFGWFSWFSASQATTMELGARMRAIPIADPAKVSYWMEILTAPSR